MILYFWLFNDSLLATRLFSRENEEGMDDVFSQNIKETPQPQILMNYKRKNSDLQWKKKKSWQSSPKTSDQG